MRVELHAWYKGAKPDASQLLNWAESVHFYPRRKPWQITNPALPYIVSSRLDASLVEKISLGNTPIWFEGIHTTGALNHLAGLSKRKIFLRSHNLEHRYYAELAAQTDNLFKKAYFLFEQNRLRIYEEKLFPHFDTIFSISQTEQKEILDFNPNTEWLPAFVNCRAQKISRLPTPDAQDFRILFHGNFRIKENVNAARALIHFFRKYAYPGCTLVLAGKDLNIADFQSPGVELHPNPHWMDAILDTVDLVLLPGKQESGVKIKLLESLAAGKRVICSPATAAGSGLESDLITYSNDEQLDQLLQKTISGNLDEGFITSLDGFRKLYNPDLGVRQILEKIG